MSVSLDDVYIYYSCKCYFNTEIKLNIADKTVEIMIKHRCPKCLRGKSRELIIGNTSITEIKCTVPHCACPKSVYRLPVHLFLNLIDP